MNEVTPFMLEIPGPNASPVVLNEAYPQPRGTVYAEERKRAVMSDTPGWFGDAVQEFVPILLDTWITTDQGRIAAARKLGDLEAILPQVTALLFGPFRMPVSRIRVQTRTPTIDGYRVTLKVDCEAHLWTDTTLGTQVPLI